MKKAKKDKTTDKDSVLERAEMLYKAKIPSRVEIYEVDKLLRRVLGDIDPFWIRWSFFREQNGVVANDHEYYERLYGEIDKLHLEDE